MRISNRVSQGMTFGGRGGRQGGTHVVTGLESVLHTCFGIMLWPGRRLSAQYGLWVRATHWRVCAAAADRPAANGKPGQGHYSSRCMLQRIDRRGGKPGAKNDTQHCRCWCLCWAGRQRWKEGQACE